MTCNKYYKYRLQQRAGETNHYLLAGRLLQEYVCLNFAKAERQRFNFVEMNQAKLRADVYQNIVDHMRQADVEENNLGRQIILPATHIGSPRDMHARFQDAMATVRRHGKPDLFITMTCNPMWKEIQDELLPGQKPENRDDLISRVFKLKLTALTEEILKNGIFGARVANMEVIEFQKRGLPHAHMLIILQPRHSIKSAEKVDQIVSAEIPPKPESIHDDDSDIQQQKREQAQRLRELVLRNMVHGPCGTKKTNSPCMYNAQGEITVMA